jgi:MYXO-CTERM domain-containing protein
MKRKSGAVALSDSEGAKAREPMVASAPVAAPSSAPPPPAPVSQPSRVVDEDEVEVSDLSGSPRLASEESDSVPLSRVKMQSDRGEKKGGCASCSLGGRDSKHDSQSLGLLLLASLALVLRRSRRK